MVIRKHERRVTMQDIANHAKVSRNLVARVINNRSGVGVENKQNILKAIEILGYRKDLIATRLAKKNNANLFGVFIFDIGSNIFVDIYNGIRDEANNLGINLLTGISDYSGKNDKQIIENLIDSRIDALLMIGSSISDKKLQEYAKIVPIISITRNIPNLDSVYNNDYSGVKQIIEHLIQVNKTQIAYIGPHKTEISKSRIKAYNLVMQE